MKRWVDVVLAQITTPCLKLQELTLGDDQVEGENIAEDGMLVSVHSLSIWVQKSLIVHTLYICLYKND